MSNSRLIQNIILGFFVAFFAAYIAYSSYKAFSSNEKKVTNYNYTKLVDQAKQAESMISTYFKASFDSLGELYYDERIKKAVFMRHTKVFPLYKTEAKEALKDFSLFKDYKNLLLFSPEYKLIGSITRTLSFSQKTVDNLIKRMEDYKDKQFILQRIGGQNLIIFILKIEYAKNHYAFLVMADDMTRYVEGLSSYEKDFAELFLVTKNLDYKNTMLRLNGNNSVNNFFIKDDTLIKYSQYFARSFNYEGKETLADTQELRETQNSHILAMLKPDYVTHEVENKYSNLKSYYITYFVLSGVFAFAYLLVLISKLDFYKKTASYIKLILDRKEKSSVNPQSKALVKEAKKEAYAYADDNGVRNSLFKVYNALKKMSPEEIRNLSIKNSLSKENIRLVYQPVVDSKTMQPQFCEVFLRLLNYYGEELMPSEFIPVLKKYGLLENLDEMMLEKIIRKIKSFQVADQSARISLNISNGAFQSSKFLKKLKAGFISGEIQKDNVMLEIPALDVINDEKSVAFVNDLSDYGVEFSVSVSTLDNTAVRKLVAHKIKYVKIDMSNFSDVLENKEKQDNLKQILSLTAKNNINIVAERIETELMFKLAKSLNIQLLQGYYIGKPKKYYTHR